MVNGREGRFLDVQDQDRQQPGKQAKADVGEHIASQIDNFEHAKQSGEA